MLEKESRERKFNRKCEKVREIEGKMMDLSLDLGLGIASKPISEFLGEVSKIGDGIQKLTKIDDFVKRLELEMRKIDGFKRELPLCMLLLNDAIGRLKEEAMQCGELSKRSGFVEFPPLKRNGEEDEMRDKRKWMSSVQLWNTDVKKQDAFPEPKSMREEDHKFAPENPIQISEGGFVPYKVQPEVMPNFPLMNPELDSCNSGLRSNSTGKFSSENQNKPQQQQEQQQNSRKQRRCWSPELHRRFVDALQKLGGSQVATPKQIRELMGVDGLTNDEVKSHLQKYRLHIRKLPSGDSNGVMMSRDRCSDSLKVANMSQSGSPLGPLLVGSGTGGNSMEGEEDERSDGQSWRCGIHKGGEIAV